MVPGASFYRMLPTELEFILLDFPQALVVRVTTPKKPAFFYDFGSNRSSLLLE